MNSFSRDTEEIDSGFDNPSKKDYPAELFGSITEHQPIKRIGIGMRVYNQ